MFGVAIATGESYAVGRYALYGELASGGMATVYLGRLLGTAGFTRLVAVKRLHPQFAKDPNFAERFVQEAQLAASVQHPNVIPTLDVVSENDELFLVMEYVRGESLARLLRSKVELSPDIACTILVGALHGLHAAHEAVDADQQPLGIVHRDVSPQNIMVGVDGVPRVLDFGIAKATTTSSVTQEGQLRGKLRYMSPEQCLGSPLDRRADLFAAGIVLWESLTRRDLFDGDEAAVIIRQVLEKSIPPPSTLAKGLPPAVDAVAMRALARDPSERFQTAREMAVALEEALPHSSPRVVGEFVERAAKDRLSTRASLVDELVSMPDAELESRLSTRTSERTLPTIIQARAGAVDPAVATPRPRASGLRAFLALVALLLIGFAGLFFWSKVTSGASAEEPASSAQVPVERSDPPEETPAAFTPSPRRETPPPTPSVTATHRSGTRPVKKVVPKPPTPVANCTPPYTIDARGDKHYKRECL